MPYPAQYVRLPEFDDVDDAMEDVTKPSEVDEEEDDDPAEEHITMPEETEEDE